MGYSLFKSDASQTPLVFVTWAGHTIANRAPVKPRKWGHTWPSPRIEHLVVLAATGHGFLRPWRKHSFWKDVSKNSGTPKSSILIGFSLINHPFWGTPIFGNIHIPKKNNTGRSLILMDTALGKSKFQLYLTIQLFSQTVWKGRGVRKG